MIPKTEEECRRVCRFDYCPGHGCFFKACGFIDEKEQAAFETALVEADNNKPSDRIETFLA